jgi:hypothetical protein
MNDIKTCLQILTKFVLLRTFRLLNETSMARIATKRICINACMRVPFDHNKQILYE